MKTKFIISSILIAGIGLMSMSCKKWTQTEIKDPVKLVGTNKPAEYYKDLRAYKKTDHQVAFGWFGNWTGVGSSLQGSFAGLPDSMDFVSMWGAWFKPTKAMLKDFHETRALKGTKGLAVDLIFDIGGKITPWKSDDELKKMGMTREQYIYKYWGWSDERTPEGLEKRQEATRRYADSIAHIIELYDYDGFDIDAEPSYPQPFITKKQLWELHLPDTQRTLMSIFIETLAKHMGPMATTAKGKERLFVIDGEPHAIPAKYGKYFNYFILQAYYDGTTPGIYRANKLIEHFKDFLTPEEVCKKIIYTCDFESGASTGGSYEGQLLGYANYKPVINGKTYEKGGIGAYHMEYEYTATLPMTNTENKTYRVPDSEIDINVKNYQGYTYPWFHAAIQLMNPAKHEVKKNNDDSSCN